MYLHVVGQRERKEHNIIDVKTITSVVAMIPMTPHNADSSTHFFLLEKPGLEIQQLGDVNTNNTTESMQCSFTIIYITTQVNY